MKLGKCQFLQQAGNRMLLPAYRFLGDVPKAGESRSESSANELTHYWKEQKSDTFYNQTMNINPHVRKHLLMRSQLIPLSGLVLFLLSSTLMCAFVQTSTGQLPANPGEPLSSITTQNERITN